MKYDNLDKITWTALEDMEMGGCPFQRAPDFSIARGRKFGLADDDYVASTAFAHCAGINCNAMIQHPENHKLGYCSLIPQPLFSPISVVDKSKTVKSVVLPKEALQRMEIGNGARRGERRMDSIQIFCDNFLEFGQTSTAFKDIVDLYNNWCAGYGLTPVKPITLRNYAKIGNQYLSFRAKKGIVYVVNVGLKRHDSA